MLGIAAEADAVPDLVLNRPGAEPTGFRTFHRLRIITVHHDRPRIRDLHRVGLGFRFAEGSTVVVEYI